MRSLLVCAALCVCYPIQTSQDLPRPQDHQQSAIPQEAAEREAVRAESFYVRFLFDSPWSPQGGLFEDMVSNVLVAEDGMFGLPDEPRIVLPTVEREPVRSYSKRELCSTVASVAEANNLPIPFFANLIQQESGFRPHVVSPAGAQGIAQFMPRVAEEHGLEDPFDPVPALHASGKFLSRLRAQFGNNLGLAAAAYNAGARRVQDWVSKRGKLPAETRQYVRNITGRPAEHWARGKVRNVEAKLPLFARCAEARAALEEARAEASAREAAAARSKPAVVARAAAKVGKRAAEKVASKPSAKPKNQSLKSAAAKNRAKPVAAKQPAETPKRARVASR